MVGGDGKFYSVHLVIRFELSVHQSYSLEYLDFMLVYPSLGSRISLVNN